MILITGGTGYIGSHTAIKLIENGHEVIILDNLVNSSRSVLDSIKKITGKLATFIEADIRDERKLIDLFKSYPITAVFHFAGLKAVGEAEQEPLLYYDNNVSGSISLLRAMQNKGVKKIVFSSSATVYGDPGVNCYSESIRPNPINVYGRTKHLTENILADIQSSDPEWRVAILRYFNPVGAHESGLIGENPKGIPNNLMPYIGKVACGDLPFLNIFGNDYPTKDGTGMRDYIHISDLASGHIKSFEHLERHGESFTINLGTGSPISVMDLVKSFEKASGRTIPFKFTDRRKGDLAEYFADPSLAKQKIGWQAEYGIDRMCQDAWRWQLQSNLSG